jgi:prolyl oligopeptidase
MDVATGELIDGPIGRTRYTPVAWLPGGKAFYYVRRLAPELVPAGEAQYHRRVWLHRLGTDAEDDVEVFGAGQPITSYFGVSVSRDGRWLVISASEGTAPRTDVWLADLDAAPPEAPALVELQRGVDAALWAAVARDGRLYLVTDRDARRRRLLVADPTDPAPAAWRELIPEDPEAVLDDFALLDGPAGPATLLLVARTRHTLAELALHDAATGAWLADVPTPSAGGSLGGLVTRPDGGSAVWFVWTAPDSPGTVYRFDAAAPEASRMLVWEQPPGTAGVVPTPPPLSVRQESYRSADGTTVRVLVLAPPECADGPDRPRPTVLYGYGGFGIALTPSYASAPLAWVAAGGVWAIAGLRGGGEEGEQWHRDGMLGAKQNVFDDFHAAAEHLIGTGWTTPEQLAINGGSNGGLLVGAALTQRPDLYRAVVCSAPLLDMIRYERFGLGASWAVEYGSASVPTEFEWLRAYSPYHHVADGTRYPAVLFTVFDSDSRVDPLHARKMCAALQHATGGDESGQDAGQGGAGPRPDGPDDTQPVLLRREADVGHGARALSRTIDLWTDTLTFLGERTGLAW